MSTIYFLGVRDGGRSGGALVFPDQAKSYYASSGPWGNGKLPEGKYSLGKKEPAEKAVSLGNAKFKYRLTGVTKKGGPAAAGNMWDPDNKIMRDGLLIHADSNGPGTKGCIGVRGTHFSTGRASSAADGVDVTAAQEVDGLLDTMTTSGDTTVVVKYFDSVADMEAYHKEIAPGTEVPKTPEDYQKDLEARKKAAEEAKKKKEQEAARKKAKKGNGKPSKTNKGAQLLKGEKTVFVGDKRLEVAYAHAECVHSGGGCVIDGSQSIFVGKARGKLGRVGDPTSDAHKIETGEPTVLVA